METKKVELMDKMEISEARELCDWLVQKGLGMGECAHVITDLELGDSFGLALLKVFKRREVEVKNEYANLDWGCPVVG